MTDWSFLRGFMICCLLQTSRKPHDETKRRLLECCESRCDINDGLNPGCLICDSNPGSSRSELPIHFGKGFHFRSGGAPVAAPPSYSRSVAPATERSCHSWGRPMAKMIFFRGLRATITYIVGHKRDGGTVANKTSVLQQLGTHSSRTAGGFQSNI